jgi:hypothetical protein
MIIDAIPSQTTRQVVGPSSNCPFLVTRNDGQETENHVLYHIRVPHTL